MAKDESERCGREVGDETGRVRGCKYHGGGEGFSLTVAGTGGR